MDAEEVSDFEPGEVGASLEVVEVDLGGDEGGVAEEAGDGAEVVAGLFAEHGGGVAQGVDGDAGGVEAGAAGVLFEKSSDQAHGERRIYMNRLYVREAAGVVVEGSKDRVGGLDGILAAGGVKIRFDRLPDRKRELVKA